MFNDRQTLLQTCHEYHEYRDVAYFLYDFCTQSVAMQLLSEQSHRVEILHYIFCSFCTWPMRYVPVLSLNFYFHKR